MGELKRREKKNKRRLAKECLTKGKTGKDE